MLWFLVFYLCSGEAPFHDCSRWAQLIKNQGTQQWCCCFEDVEVLWIIIQASLLHPRKMGAYVISRLNRKIDDILDFTLCFFKKEKKKSSLMKQVPNKPHLNIIFLTLWLCFKLFPNFLSEKWLIIIINSGKTNIKVLSLVPPKVPCIRTPNVYIYFPVRFMKTWLCFIIKVDSRRFQMRIWNIWKCFLRVEWIGQPRSSFFNETVT